MDYPARPPRRRIAIDGIITRTPPGGGSRQPALSRQRMRGHSRVAPTVQPLSRPVRPAAAGAQPMMGAGSITSTMPLATPLPDAPPRRRGKLGGSKAAKGERRWGWKKLLKRSSLALLVIILLVGGWVGWKFYRNAAKITHNNNPLSLLSVFHPVPLKSQNGRVNILVAGDSADDAGHQGAQLTDSIMILSIDTHTHSALMVSVPRDLWVYIPSLGHQKINAANTVTDFTASGYPHGGMGQLEKVITDNLGVPIDYYALVNYTAFRDLVNAVGGITITVQSSDPRGLYDPSIDYATHGPLVKLPNGPATLNGEQALDLARARGDTYGAYGFPQADFDRTQHQRQMALAIKDKISSASVIANPLKISQLADAVGNNVQTDLKLDELETLYSLTKNISDSSIQQFSLNTLVSGQYMLKGYVSSNGQDALIPAAGIDDFSQIQAALTKLMSSDPVVKEGASVVVLNATNTVGLASKQAKVLTAKGMNVVAVSDTPSRPTTIIDSSKGQKPNTLKALKSLYGTNVTTSSPLTATYTADFIVVLGNDQTGASNSANSQ